MDMLVNYEVCVCMCEEDRDKEESTEGKKDGERERKRKKVERRRESVLIAREDRCQSEAGVCIQINLEDSRGGYIYVCGQMFYCVGVFVCSHLKK